VFPKSRRVEKQGNYAVAKWGDIKTLRLTCSRLSDSSEKAASTSALTTEILVILLRRALSLKAVDRKILKAQERNHRDSFFNRDEDYYLSMY
jgi:hypothetical protein